MKQVYIAILLVVFGLNTKAQTNVYHPFPDTSAKWNETYVDGISGCCCSNCTQYFYNVSFLAGDTIISTLHYKKILSSGYENNPYCGGCNCCYFYNSYVGAIRQDSIHKKVYYCRPSTTIDTLLYNFNLTVGDTLPKSYVNSLYPLNYVSSIDSILIGTKYRKQYHITYRSSTYPYLDSNYTQLIEGIGSTSGLTSPLSIGGCENGCSYYLNCFSQNGITTYTNPMSYFGCDNTLDIKQATANNEELNIYPNPSKGQLTIDTKQTKGHIVVYNPLGEKLYEADIDAVPININLTASGVFQVVFTTVQGVLTKKVVVTD